MADSDAGLRRSARLAGHDPPGDQQDEQGSRHPHGALPRPVGHNSIPALDTHTPVRSRTASASGEHPTEQAGAWRWRSSSADQEALQPVLSSCRTHTHAAPRTVLSNALGKGVPRLFVTEGGVTRFETDAEYGPRAMAPWCRRAKNVHRRFAGLVLCLLRFPMRPQPTVLELVPQAFQQREAATTHCWLRKCQHVGTQRQAPQAPLPRRLWGRGSAGATLKWLRAPHRDLDKDGKPRRKPIPTLGQISVTILVQLGLTCPHLDRLNFPVYTCPYRD